MPVHLKGLTPEDIGVVTLLAGDPDRIRMISENWDNPNIVSENREFVFVNGYWKGRKVSACSTGIGIGSTEIAIIELAELGAKMLVRLGGCGAWKEHIQPGELIINHGMARDSGTLKEYAEDVYPAVANPILVNCLLENAKLHGYKTHCGIGLTTQSYYLGQGRKPNLQKGLYSSQLMKYWEERSIINCDMETAVLYILSSIYGIHAANCLVTHGNRVTNEWMPDEKYKTTHLKVSTIVLEACFKAFELLA